jgi:hypothetical protein
MSSKPLNQNRLEAMARQVTTFFDQPDELGFCLRHRAGHLAVMAQEGAALVCQTWNEAEAFRKQVIGQHKGHAPQWKVVPLTSRRLAQRPLLAFRFGTGEGLSSYFVVKPAELQVA